MRCAAIRSTASTTRLVAVVLAGSTAITLALPTLGATAQAAARSRPTTIVVQAGSPKGAVRPHQLGVNHRFVGNGHGMWDPAANAPRAEVVTRLRRAGVSDIRFPGGIIGNLYDWKKAIGPNRECQVSGKRRDTGFGGVSATGYGPDEHMDLVEQVGADATMMVPFITETPEDAADWVEYMNTPAGDGINPNGGTDWAQVRSDNGHDAPYDVNYWEIGNEQRTPIQRYWMSPKRGKALRQYANGGQRVIEKEFLGRGCSHPFKGSVSNGRPNQVFRMLYPPVKPDSVTVTVVDRTGAPLPWTSVPSLDSATGDQKVYTVNEASGTVTFGDNTRGAVLPEGLRVRAKYTSVHKGVFEFIRQMKEVDPSISACVTWGLEQFIRVAAGRKYDCFAVHAYTNFVQEKTLRWRSAVQGHDRHMLGAIDERSFIQDIKRQLPAGVSLAVTEFGSILGKTRVYPEWSASMTHATYMASMWVSLMNMGIPMAEGNAVVGPSNRGLLGAAPNFTVSAEALTREAIKPMYEPGNRRVGVKIARNPVRHPRVPDAGGYPALSVAATKAPGRELRILVVNRLPNDRVAARVDLRGFTSRGFAFVSTVNGASFRSWNTPRATEVHLRTDRRGIGRDGFRGVFPAHSVTVIRVPAR
jgi:alpha-L-arabinofuranosidase